MKLPATFRELIAGCHIEIPLLQRDYAQGRDDKKTEAVRERFVEELFTATTNKKPLELDFIYGPIQGNTFVPLDGQQRLTTLFLLHWYVAKREEQKCPDLKKFTYRVRTTTQEFLHALLNKEVDLCRPPKEEITDAPWYYSAWDVDPSVQGMLTMLDAIHEQYEKSKRKLWNDLDNVRFQLLNMGQYQLTDDLYMKMNARGVPLTDFENFKAWLEKKLSEQTFDVRNSNGWKVAMDKDWTDFFWSIRDPESDEIDTAFLRFFKAVALNSYAAAFSGNIEEGDDAAQYRKNIARLNGGEYIPLAEYEEVFKLTERDTISAVFAMLDKMATAEDHAIKGALGKIHPFREKDKKFPLIEVLNREMFSYPEQMLFYGMFLALGENNVEEFSDWMRVVRNLVLNTQIDSPQTFVRAIKGLKKLHEAAKENVLGYLSKASTKVIDGFRETQIEEEVQKAILLKSRMGDCWRVELLKYENHRLFEGQIGFLLKKAEGSSEWLSAEEIDLFKARAVKGAKLWDDKGSVYDREKDYLLFRALIASGYLELPDGGVDISNSKANWKRLLRGGVLPGPLLRLLDAISGKDLPSCLERLFEDVSSDHNLWRYLQGAIPHCGDSFAVCHGEVSDGVLELRKSYRAHTQNRRFLSSRRDRLFNDVADLLGSDAVVVDLHTGKHVERRDFYTDEWLTVGFSLQHEGGSAYIAYTTDGLIHEIGVRKDRKTSLEKYDQITELVKSRLDTSAEDVTLVQEDNWWWYACGRMKKPEADKVAQRLQTLRDRLTKASDI